MEERETIEVYIETRDGKTVCICKRSNKRCSKYCQPDVVERDKFRDWQKTMARDKYGK